MLKISRDGKGYFPKSVEGCKVNIAVRSAAFFCCSVCYCRCVASVTMLSHGFSISPAARGPGKHARPVVLIGRRGCHGNRVPRGRGPIGREATRRRVRASRGRFDTGMTTEMRSGSGSSHVVPCGGSLHGFHVRIQVRAHLEHDRIWRILFVIVSWLIDILSFPGRPAERYTDRYGTSGTSQDDEAFGP